MQEVKKVELASNDVKLLAIKGYTVGDPLNSGSFACVCKATVKGKAAAVKVIDLEKTSDDYRLKFLPRELYTMKKLSHPFVIQVLDIFTIGNRVLSKYTAPYKLVPFKLSNFLLFQNSFHGAGRRW